MAHVDTDHPAVAISSTIPIMVRCSESGLVVDSGLQQPLETLHEIAAMGAVFDCSACGRKHPPCILVGRGTRVTLSLKLRAEPNGVRIRVDMVESDGFGGFALYNSKHQLVARLASKDCVFRGEPVEI